MAPPRPPQKPFRLLLLLNISFLVVILLLAVSPPPPGPPRASLRRPRHIEPGACTDFDSLDGAAARCAYLSRPNPCSHRGFVDYLHLFYCACGGSPLAGYPALALCLLLLFYLLGNTASVYFCASLDSLSRLLRLPPTVAGVTLLSLGNGAPDAFSTVASFSSPGPAAAQLGLSSVLGGAFFVTSAVVALISLCVAPRSLPVDSFSFFRDVSFYLLVLCLLVAVLLAGNITLAAAVAFASLYIVYIALVAASYRWRTNRRRRRGGGGDLHLHLHSPLLQFVADDIEDPTCPPKQAAPALAPAEEEFKLSWLLCVLELPLSLPRRLTIPDVSDERWSKPFAVASVILSPILLATLWNSTRGKGLASDESLTVYLFAALVGVVLGVVALETTESHKPPHRVLLPWLAAEFLMSVVWFYITAGELVSLLVSVGHVLGISPSVLAVTVLAWGNSVGDLIANVAMALHGGDDGVQIAISGCYAVPIFNTLVGLGASLVFTSWSAHPAPFVIPEDSSVMVTVGFLVCGLGWALAMLPTRGMKLDRVFGAGLLALYLCFLCLRISDSLGLVEIDDLFQ